MANVIRQGQLEYKHGKHDARVSGPPDDLLLSRKEGYEVLYFISKFCQLHKLTVILLILESYTYDPFI
jgi:hypothetical protein